MRPALLGLLVAVAALGASTAPWAFAQSSRPTVLSRLIWFDRSGSRLGAIGPIADHGNIEISPDGTRVAVAVNDAARATRDIWMYNLGSGERTQFTSEPSDENWLIWSPDGARVLLNSFARDRLTLLEAPSSGANERTPLLEGDEGKWPVSWSPDGKYVLYVTNNNRTSNDIWVLLRDGSGSPFPYLHTAASENWAAFSPDGKWVAFSAADANSGQPEVFVAPFPAPTKRFRISADGGSQARWRKDGKEILYLAPNRMLMSAQLETNASGVTVKDYEPLFELQHPYGAYHAFDLTRDGQRILVNTLVVNPGSRGVIATLR
jgi:dipeptidyl aminopeptidase/acylaminoacyl peptidase